MGKIVITAGDKYTDIDVLACAIAYGELLGMEDKKAVVVLPGVFNKSITGKIKEWKLKYEKVYRPEFGNNFVVVDLSEPGYIAKFVNQDKITKLFDHHFGFEEYWKEKLGKNSKIEKVGSCATLIWEEYLKRNRSNDISQLSANLLYTAIISNTLNFKASVTSKRDKDTFHTLEKHINLPSNWIETYFKEQEEAVFRNPQKEIKNDTHIETFPGTNDKLIIGQIELWNSEEFVSKYKNDIKEALKSFGGKYWFLTAPSISEGKNYIYTDDKKVQLLLADKLGVSFDGSVGITSKLILRKEIRKTLHNY